ncbi:hypothetical protein Tco_1160623 [Tanacetum coccineum]
MIKEHDQQAKEKTTPRKLIYDGSEEENSDSSKARGKLERLINESSGTSQTINKTHSFGKKGKEPVPKEKDHSEGYSVRTLKEKAKLPRDVQVYEGSKDPKDHLAIFLAVAEQEEWPMPIWCRMFRQTLRGTVMDIWSLPKKLNDKIPKKVDKIFKRVRAFIRGEAVAGSAEVARASQWDKGATPPMWSEGQERTRGRSDQREFQRNMGTMEN